MHFSLSQLIKDIWELYNPGFVTLMYVTPELNKNYLDSSEANVSDFGTEQPNSPIMLKYS